MKIAWSGCWSWRAVGATLLVAYSSVACGGAPNTKPLSADTANAAKDSVTGVENAPVSAPAGVIALGRARDYRQWVKLEQASPMVAYLKKMLVEEQGDALLSDWDLTQPVEFIATFERNFQRTKELQAPPPKPEAGQDAEPEGDDDDVEEATPVAPVDSIESHFFAAFSLPLAHYAPDSYEALGFKRWTSNAYERGNCLVTPALGSAKARLICSDHPDVTRHFYGYLARGLPLEPLSAAPLFVELRPQPLKELWEPSRASALSSLHALAQNGGNTSRLLEDLTLNLVKEVDTWVASAQTLRFEGGPNERGEFEANLTLALRSPQPWLVESSLAGAAKIHGAPSAFLNLPKDVGEAWYSYGMPAERTAVLQSALVNLAKTALQEFGPVSRLGSAKLTAAEGKTADRLVAELISTLDSPCICAEQAVFANIPADTRELEAYTNPKPVKIAKQRQRGPMVPLDVLARALLGQYLVAFPSTASCPQYTEHWLDMLATLLQALPPKEKQKFPLATSVRKSVKLKGLPPATVARISLPKHAVTRLMKEFKSDKRYYNYDAPDSAGNRWAASQGPMVLSVIIVPSADATGSDWIGLGLDEKQLLQALLQATHPVPGQTLAARADLAPFIARNPTSLSFQSFEALSRLMALVSGADFGPALAGLNGLFHGTSVVSTTHINLRANIAEIGLSYYLSKEGLAAFRQILGWDIEHILEIAKAMNQKDSASQSDPNAK